MKGLVFTLILMVFFLSINAQESTKKSRKQCKEEKQAEQIKKVSELVKNKTFVFNVHQAKPLCGDAVSLEYLYFVKVNNNTVNSYLPFYGFESELSIENTPLDFTKSFENYSTKKEDNKYVINFNVPVENDNIKFYFQISELGYTYLKITSTQKQGISFLGIIEENKPEISSRF
jgi:hypothetical protein